MQKKTTYIFASFLLLGGILGYHYYQKIFGKAITKEHIKTKKREFYIDTLKFKEFYLRIKIANIRKRLTENESLNKEICIDWKTNKDLINVKLMVKALEELAEEE